MNRRKTRCAVGHPHTRHVAVALCLIVGLWFDTTAWALTMDVNCGMPAMKVGEIVVNPVGSGMSGDFNSTAGGPPPTLAAAAAACGEHHFNWFQVVTADNMPPNDQGGNALMPPYIDPPLGGYGPPSPQWADGRPWYWDETAPPGPPFPPGYQPGLGLGPNTFAGRLHWEDFPGGAAGSNVKFSTWLVSLNADGSLHEFHEGFSWMWSNPTGGAGTSMFVGGAGGTGALTPQQGQALYNQVVPEPASIVLFAMALCAIGLRQQRLA